MFRKYTLLAICGLLGLTASATYIPVTVTGFNEDVIANGSGSVMSSTTNNADGGLTPNSWCFVAPNYLGPLGQTATSSLPSTGLITSVVTSTPGLTFQLASYSSSNDLRLQGTNSGTLTLSTPQSAAEIWLLAFSGNGACTMSATVTFTDATTQTFTGISVPDWFGGSGFAIQGISRVNRDNDNVDNNTTNPRLYQFQLALSSGNYSKLIQSIAITKGSTTNVNTTLGVMAVTINTASSVSITSTSTSICAGSSVTFTATPVNGGTSPSYQWKKNGVNIPGATSSTYTTTTLAAGDIITVAMTSSNGGAAPNPATSNSITMTVSNGPATPGPITGVSAPCGGSIQAYSVAPVTGAVSYVWTLPSGWTGTSSTNSITTLVGGPGTLSVVAVNSCGTSPASTLAITLGTPTGAPASVSGSIAVCPGSTQTYTASAVSGATSYTWTLPSGWSGTSTTNSITVTAGTSGGSIAVSAVNGCGTGPAYILPITMNPSVASTVSITSSVGTSLCSGTTATFTAIPVSGGSSPSYQWVKNGSNVGPNNAVYSDNNFVNGDQIKVILTSSNLCPVVTSSNIITLNVTSQVTPGINVNTAPGTQLCAGTPITFVSNIVGGGPNPSYQWRLNGVNVGTNAPTYTNAALSDLDTITCVLTSSATCPTFATITSNKMGVNVIQPVTPTITISANPATPVPSGTDITFTATYNGGGANPTFQWLKNGYNIPYAINSSYTTNNLHGGDVISVKMVSYAPCPTTPSATSNLITVPNGTGISTIGNWDGTITLYPNPSNGHFTISADWAASHIGERVRIDMVNALGQVVYNTEVVPDRTKWSVDVWLNNSVANGMYTLRLRTSAGAQAAKPIMVQR